MLENVKNLIGKKFKKDFDSWLSVLDDLGYNSSLIISKFYCNNKCNEVVNINLNERDASIKYNFSSININDNFYKINVYHLDNKTSSDIFNRIVANKDSSNYLDINSYVNNSSSFWDIGCS